ncbi:MAG: ORF6N domain-containing protein [Limisphaerales bacterium]
MILLCRGQKIILDTDLANIYGVDTKRLNEAVRRNGERFPSDFLFKLTATEAQECYSLRSQIATLKRGQHRKYLPFAFTEHGAMMAANVLRSERAVTMSIFVVRAFNKMRELLANNKALAEKLTELEKKLTGRLDQHEHAILHILEELKKLAAAPDSTESQRREIGFHVKGSLKNPVARRIQNL